MLTPEVNGTTPPLKRQKPVRTVRRNVFVIVKEGTPVPTRALEWELAATRGTRRIHDVWAATRGAEVDGEEELYILDMELVCRGANRHDFTKFVRHYLPECSRHFISV